MIPLDTLLAATNGILYTSGSQTSFTAFSHDSRQILSGEMFVAVRGLRGDGHDFLLDALEQGASGLLIEERVLKTLSQDILSRLQQANVTTVVVQDTRLALQQYARTILELWQPTVIAVTGSVGKTSTKEAIATVLASNFATFRSWENYNDLLGLPLSLGRLEKQHQFAVLELGCDHPGEIAQLCAIARPRIGVLTNISPVQMLYFENIDHLASELMTIFTSLREQGTAIYNADDTLISELMSRLPQCTEHSSIPYAPSRVRNVEVTWEGIHCTLPSGEQTGVDASLQLFSQLLGEHHVATMLATYTVARHCNLQPAEIQQALAQVRPVPGRLYPLQGIDGTRLLDDTHNASPLSMSAGLETLKTLPASRRVAALGDMLNLGNSAGEEHLRLGEKVRECADYLVTRGEHAALIAESARQAGLLAEHVFVTSTHEDAAWAVRDIIKSNADAVVLIKGSEDTRMEKVTELLMDTSTQTPALLVRQSPAWKQIVVTRPDRPTWVAIDLNTIGNNTRLIKELVGPAVRVLVSLKADAYGHGALKVARTVLRNGASLLGVATVSEAVPLREAGITAPILVFGYVPPWQMREAVRLGLTVTLYSPEAAQALARAAQALDKTVKVHAKIDSGMGRLGVRAEQLDAVLELVSAIAAHKPVLEFEGLYTHMASADAEDLSYSRKQLARFQRVLTVLDEHGLRPPIIHAANSAATLSLPEARFTMVRPGIAIYGLDPSTHLRLPQGFRAALSFKTLVAQVKMLPAGECVSYGCTYVTDRPTRIAVLPVGYADGFRRAPNNWGSVLLHGQEAPILGRVCMDQCMVDVTHIPQTRVGDEVVLIGQQGQTILSAETVAQRLGTINYEVVSEILARVPRVD
jgi:Alr-MurF fusion protein